MLDCADLAIHYAAVLRKHAQSRHALMSLPISELSQRARGATAAMSSMDASLAELVARREALYNCTKRISSTTIKVELKPHLGSTSDGNAFDASNLQRQQLRYRIDPISRYTHLPQGPEFDWDGSVRRRAELAKMREAAAAAEAAAASSALEAIEARRRELETEAAEAAEAEVEAAAKRRLAAALAAEALVKRHAEQAAEKEAARLREAAEREAAAEAAAREGEAARKREEERLERERVAEEACRRAEEERLERERVATVARLTAAYTEAFATWASKLGTLQRQWDLVSERRSAALQALTTAQAHADAVVSAARTAREWVLDLAHHLDDDLEDLRCKAGKLRFSVCDLDGTSQAPFGADAPKAPFSPGRGGAKLTVARERLHAIEAQIALVEAEAAQAEAQAEAEAALAQQAEAALPPLSEALEALSTALDRIDAQLVEHRSNQPVKPAHMLDDGWCC